MEGNYPIYSGTESVGQVHVIRQGLYYHFACRCVNNNTSVCRLMVQCAEDTVSLGILVPEKKHWVLTKRVPVKHIPAGEPLFYIGERERNSDAGIFAEITPDEPFQYLSKLQYGFLAYKKGKPGLWIPDKS